MCVYCVDALGRDVVRGYGAVHLPMTPGRCVRRSHELLCLTPAIVQAPRNPGHVRTGAVDKAAGVHGVRCEVVGRAPVPMRFNPNCLPSWVLGQRPEFVYPNFVAESEGREGAQMEATG